METNEVIGNKFAGTIKGRHIIEFDIMFNHKNDFDNFLALDLIIERKYKNFLNYPN